MASRALIWRISLSRPRRPFKAVSASSSNPQVIAALVGAAASLIVSALTFFSTRSNQKAVEQLRADLADRNAQRSARLEYEFDARKRLYAECAPLLFELSELAERALGRITGLARTAAAGDLDGADSWLARGYYARSTYYRLLAPLAIGRLLRRKLTHLDLSVDATTHWQYFLCKQLADTFTDDFDFAKYAPEVEYSPHSADAAERRVKEPSRYWQQGIPRGILDNAVSSLIRSDADGDAHVIEYAEFETRVQQDQDAVAQTFKRIDYLLTSFHPRTHPILWRMLVAQAHLYRALLLARENPPSPKLWEDLWGEVFPDFDWRTEEERRHVERAVVVRAVEIGEHYAASRSSATLAKLGARSRRRPE